MSTRSTLTIILLILTALLASACGAIATPKPPAPPTPEPVTLVPRPVEESADEGATEGEAVAEAPTEAPTEVPPTPVPPTATPTDIPPTATATATPTPTEIPPTATPELLGDAEAGEVLFTEGKDEAPGCVTCHYVDQDAVLIGPSMFGLPERAAERVAGLSVVEYLRQSILEPNAYLVPNTEDNVYAAGDSSLMFQQYADYLSDQEVDDLIAYMLAFE